MLLKVGVALMFFALALTAVAVVVTIALREEPEEARALAFREEPEPTVEPLIREYLPPKPEVKKAEASEARPEPRKAAPEPQKPAPKPPPEPPPEPQREILPVVEQDWPMPTQEEVQAANGQRHYELPRGAVMGLTIKSLGLHNVPVFDSNGRWALNNGVAHMPGTSFPWSTTPQRNVYLAGHRLGWRGTESHLVFYELDELGRGNEILLKDRDGKKFRYRVTEAFVTGPRDSWVMGQVSGRDMVTLQTCTPIPEFDKRLIVRADRI
jgi:sortase A